ncbi:MAG: hypothetical protein AAF494_02115 [Pseudomonadota bacterium]
MSDQLTLSSLFCALALAALCVTASVTERSSANYSTGVSFVSAVSAIADLN